MKLQNYTITGTFYHEWLEQGQTRFEVGARTCEAIESTPTGIVVTLVPDVGAPRTLLLPATGVGAGMSEAQAKTWEAEFKQRRAEAKERANSPKAHETPMEVP